MRELPFTNTQDIYKKCSGRNVVTFGAGNISDKTRRIVPDGQVAYIADNSDNLWGHIEEGAEVCNPERIRTELSEGQCPFVIITTTSFVEVSNQLAGFGLTPGEDYIVSPVLNDLRIISELESIERTMIFSSGSPVQDSPDYGGGLYELRVEGDSWSHKKILSGNCYGIIDFGDNFVTVDNERGIFEFDRAYNIVRSQTLPIGTRAHGVAYSQEFDRFYIVGSYLDSVLVLDSQFNIVDKIPVSNKLDRDGAASHHCNDCCVVGTSLYISMFSHTGNWKRDVFDWRCVGN